MTITFASLFTGGGGTDLGAIAAGLTPIWGIEKDPDIAEIGQLNINKTIYGIARKVDRENPLICDHIVAIREVEKLYPNWWEGKVKHNRVPDWLHASPPCVNASRANNGKETQEDMELANAICRAIETLQPQYFSLENVAGYEKYFAFTKIFVKLDELGYKWTCQVLDCSKYGIPQTRKRLFLVASKNRNAIDWDLRLKPTDKPVGWYEAIADLIPTLPECNLTKSQEWRLLDNEPRYGIFPFSPNAPLHLLSSCPNLAIQNSGSRKDKNGNPTNIIRLANEPIWTIKAMSGNVRPNPHQVTLIVNGKVLRPSIECYARWQTFPFYYQWSDDFKLNVKMCGNAVPPLMFQQIVEAVLKEANHG